VTTLLLALVVAVSGMVQGRVLTPDGTPVVGATVAVDSLGVEARTGEDGAFRLEDLPPGRWSLRVGAPGFVERRLIVRVSGAGPVRIDVELSREETGAADSTAALGGVVLDGHRMEPVAHALVEVVEADRSTLSQEDGSFSMDLRAGAWTLRVTAPGYRTLSRSVRVAADGGRSLGLLLEIEPLPIPGLSVGGSNSEDPGRAVRIESPSARVVDSAFARLRPTALERDLLRSVQALPAVTPSSDYSSALFVRGGTPDQTRIFLDGAPVYNPFHLGGFVSAFTPEAVDAAILQPGGLAASAPSSLAGVLDIRTRRPDTDSVHVAGELGLLSSSATVDAPLPGGAALVSARRTYLDLATRGAAGLGLVPDGGFPYHFTDLLGKVRLDGSAGTTVTATGYLDREAFLLDREGDHDRVDARWGSDLVSVRAARSLSDDLRLEGGVATSGFDGHLRRWQAPVLPDSQVAFTYADSSLNEAGIRTVAADVSLRADLGGHLLFAGGRWERSRVDHDLRPGLGDDDYVLPLRVAARSGGPAVYLRDRWRPGGAWTLDGGMRFVHPRGRGWRLLPRARVERTLGPNLDVALSSGAYVQDWWSLRNEEAGWSAAVGYDLLAPVPQERALPTAWDATAELRGRLGAWGLRMDLFHKSLRNVPTARPSLDPLHAPIIVSPDSILLGTGRVDGVELSLAGRVGDGAVSLGYRWQDERRTLNGTSFTPRTERRHRLVVSATRPFWGERELALSVTWMSGVPVTPVRALLPGIDGIGSDGRPSHTSFAGTLLFGPPNTDRLPSYLRIDLESRGSWDLTLFGHTGRIEPYISILNVLDDHNALVAEHRADRGRILRESDPQLPIFPSFGLRWRF
jgi:hypothetical protein